MAAFAYVEQGELHFTHSSDKACLVTRKCSFSFTLNDNSCLPSNTTVYCIQQCYMFRCIRPSAGTDVYDLKTCEMRHKMLKFARSPKFYYCCNIRILGILFCVSSCS